MLSAIANKKNIVILSGLIAYKPFINVGKSGDYANFLLAQETKGVFRYLKILAFNELPISQLRKLTKQCIVEIDGHISLSSVENKLTYLLVCDTIRVVNQYDKALITKGRIKIEDYNEQMSAVESHDDIVILEEKLKSLK